MERSTKKVTPKRVVRKKTPAKKTMREQIAAYALIVSQFIVVVTTILLPIVFLPFTVLSFSATKLSFLYLTTLLAFLAYVIHILFKQEKKITIPFDILSCGLYAMGITYGVAAMVSTNTFISVWGRDFAIDSLLSIAVFFMYGLLVSVHVAKDVTFVLKIAFGLAITSFLVVVLKLVTIFSGVTIGNIFFDGSRSTVGSWYDFGLFAMLMVFILLFCVTQLKLITKITWFLWITAGLYFVTLSISGNTLAWILLSFGCVALLLFQFFTKRTVHRSAAVVLVVSILCVVFSSNLTTMLVRTLGIPVEQQALQLDQSLVITRATLQSNPLWGIGPARFESQLPLFFNDVLVSSPYWQVDFRYAVSYLATIPTTVGIVGAVPWLAIPIGLLFLWIMFYFKGMYLQAREHRIFFSAMVLAFMLLIMIGLQTPSVVIVSLFVLCLGIVLGVGSQLAILPVKHVLLSKTYLRWLANGAALIAIVFTVGLLVEVTQKTHAELLYTQSQKIIAEQGSFDEALRAVQKAQSLYTNDTYALAQNIILFSELEAAIITQSLETTSSSEAGSSIEIIRTINQNFATALSFDADNYWTYITIGNFYRLLMVLAEPTIADQAYAEAKNSYRKSLERKPDNPIVFVEIARLEELRGDYEQARIALEKALQIKPDYFEAMLYAVEFEQLHGNQGSVLQLLRSFVADNPDNAMLRLLFAEAQAQAGNVEGAIASVRRLRALGLNGEDVVLQISASLISKKMNNRARLFLEKTQEVFGESQRVAEQLKIMTK